MRGEMEKMTARQQTHPRQLEHAQLRAPVASQDALAEVAVGGELGAQLR